MQDIHVNTLIAAGKESLLVLLGFDASSNTSQDESTRVDGFEVSSRHLQDKRVRCGHDSDQSGSALDTSASFVLFWFVRWHFEV